MCWSIFVARGVPTHSKMISTAGFGIQSPECILMLDLNYIITRKVADNDAVTAALTTDLIYTFFGLPGHVDYTSLYCPTPSFQLFSLPFNMQSLYIIILRLIN